MTPAKTHVRTLAITLALFLLSAGVAEASWYDDYDDGLKAARAGNWNVVVQKMSAAIKGAPKENNKAKTYGMNFINYHPYYYRGVANMNLGRYEEAIADFERTSGPGPENLGELDTLMERAKKQLAAANAPAPEPVRTVPEPVRTAPVQTPVQQQPAVPTIDPTLRSRASTALNAAKQKIQAAQGRKATTSPQYTQAMSMFTDATTRNAQARSNDDLNAIIDMAENAGTLAELAMPLTASAPAPATIVPSPGTVTPKPAAATSAVLADYSRDVRRALENYFAGEFEAATKDFEYLSRQMPGNGWIWAFLGASQYSVYAFEADDNYRDAALRSFSKAKQLRKWSGGLPEKYFSRRIRNAFAKTAG
jgi:tetratricopeptide (TPR) repeat protein